MFKRTMLSKALLIAFGGTAAVSVGSVFAQDANVQQLQRVEITGSSIKRIDAETALPVTVVTREEIKRSGVINMEQLVSSISATTTAGAARGSDLAGLSSYGTSSVSLRGLGDNRTLVLVNGRRLAVFASDGGAVNINAIPLGAVERVEVLRDGASAVYGSDAVAGVINFILRKDFNGLEATVDLGTPTKSGGGKTNRANLLFGFGDLSKDKFNISLGADFERSSALFASERDFSKSGNQPPYFSNAATPSGRIEGIWIPGQTQAQNARSSTNPYGYSSSGYGNPFAPNRCADINMFPVAGKGGVGGAFDNCNFDSAPFVGLFPKTDRTNIFGTFNVELSAAATLYGEAMWARNEVKEAYQPAPARVAFLATDNAFKGSGVDPALLIFPTNPAYASIVSPYLQSHGLAAMDGKPLAITYRAFGNGLRTEDDVLTQSRFLLGVKGTLGAWDYDAAALSNESKTEGGLTAGYFSQLALAKVLNSSNWNPWASGGAQDATIASQLAGTNYVGPTLTGKSKQTSADVTASRSLFDMTGGPVQMALGGSVRHERYQIDVPAILGTGDIAGLGGATPNEDAGRTVAAAYTEFNFPVLKNLEVNASARYDHYSDVGSTTNGKLSTRWTPLKDLLFRAAVGTGFRAPTLSELHKPSTTGTSEQFIDPLFPADGQVQANAINGGNDSLKPEKSKQFSFGTVVSLVPNWTFGVDYFVIKIDDYIISPAALGLVNAVRAGSPLYGPNDATFAPDGTVDTVDQRLRNAASADVRGFDVNVNWTNKYSFGKFSADLSGTYMERFDLKTLAGTQGSVGTIIQSDGSPLDVASTGVVPRWKHTLTGNWSYNFWSVTLIQNFILGYGDANDLNGDPHRVPSYSTYDGQVAFGGIKNLRLALGVRNMLDKKPPVFIGNGSSFQYGYDPTQYDPRGRFAYVTATYKFW